MNTITEMATKQGIQTPKIQELLGDQVKKDGPVRYTQKTGQYSTRSHYNRMVVEHLFQTEAYEVALISITQWVDEGHVHSPIAASKKTAVVVGSEGVTYTLYDWMPYSKVIGVGVDENTALPEIHLEGWRRCGDTQNRPVGSPYRVAGKLPTKPLNLEWFKREFLFEESA